jgi:hypothetical protein
VPYRFTVGFLRAIYVSFFGFVAVIQVVQIFNPGKGGIGLSLFAAAGAAVSILLTVRGARAATVLTTDRGVEYRSLVRTRRRRWAELTAFEARDSYEGVMRYRRRMLFARDAEGHDRKLQEINARSSRRPNPIDEVALHLNARLGQAPPDP